MKKPGWNGETPDQMIARHGWMVQAVFADPPSGQPGFAYTVGLAAKGLPELVVFALPQEYAMVILNQLAMRLTKGETVPRNHRMSDLMGGADALLLPAARERADEFMFQALYRYPDYQAVQVVWTDPAKKFPWEPGYQARYIPLQPLLGPAPLLH